MPRMPSLTRSALLALMAWGSSALAAQTPAFPPPPSPSEVTEARAALEAMKSNERGPFLRIRWFCADGTVQEPQGTPCAERGGGVQHAEHSPAAQRLEALGYDVGTILQATDYDEFADEARGGYRLLELVLQDFLVGVDDGWVLRRARYYRGALQVEDEERAGRALLERRLADHSWTAANALLAHRLVASVPHTRLGTQGTTDRIRALATEIADADPGFVRLRVRIHSAPSSADLDAVVGYLARAPEAVRPRLEALRDALHDRYDPARALASLEAYERRLPELAAELRAVRDAVRAGDDPALLRRLSELSPRVRELAERAPDGRRALDLMDLQAALQERAFVAAQEPEGADEPSRLEALERYGRLADLAYGAGYLSGRERAALHEELDHLRSRGALPALEYKAALGYLSRGLDWARAGLRGTFSPAIDRYVPVEPGSAGLVDALVRGSVLLPASRTLDLLQSDADAAIGASHEILGVPTSHGARGLNPGVALAPLRVLTHHDDPVDARTIYVLPETPPELKPVAGVLTLDEGNLLSHVQLLARNLGIPNAAVSPTLLPRLSAAEGQPVFYAVTPLGRVVLKRPEELSAVERALVDVGQPGTAERYHLDTSRLRLDAVAPIPLGELRAEASGVVVGPKAANLGQLAADFPGRVSRGVALPFGMFVRHASRPFGGSTGTVLEELRAAYARAVAMRAERVPGPDIDAFMLERLAWVRTAIEGLDWIPEVRSQVVQALGETLGGDVSRGVFVRSDTNVEDLPQFSGAGLNLTVAHQTSVEDVLASIKRVWTSPFSERAYLWRSQILEEQGDVYPSVLLLESVPSAKSGVLITSGLQEGGAEDLTVVTAEGVGGAVEGEDAETLVVGSDGSVRLLSQAKSPRRRELTKGGTRWVVAARPDTLLQPAELEQLRGVVAAWKEKLTGTPDEHRTWDMEFGFVEGRLWLFQIRPFIRFRNSDVYDRLQALDARARDNAGRSVDLSQQVGSP